MFLWVKHGPTCSGRPLTGPLLPPRCCEPQNGGECQREANLITVIVQFSKLPQPLSLAEAKPRFTKSAEKFRNMPGLTRKCFVVSDDGRTAGGVYLWESRTAAERYYTQEWVADQTARFGVAPTLTWLETPVVTDNVLGKVITG